MTKRDYPLMRKATAAWLIDNTSLTFDQIADFCGMHVLEVETMANDESGNTITATNPLYNGELTQAEIDRVQDDPKARLKISQSSLPEPAARTKGPRYTPLAKRDDKPNGVAWVLKAHPELADSQIVRLIGTTKDTIEKVRSRSHWNMANIKPSNPVLAGLCKQADLDEAVRKATRKLEREGKALPAGLPAANMDADAVADYGTNSGNGESFGSNDNGTGDQPDYYDRDAASN